MNRIPVALAGLALAVAVFVFGGLIERLLIVLFLGLPAAFFLPQYLALWIAYQITGEAKYRPSHTSGSSH